MVSQGTGLCSSPFHPSGRHFEKMGCWEARRGFCPRKGKGKGCKWCEGAPDSAGKGGGVWKPQFQKSWGPLAEAPGGQRQRQDPGQEDQQKVEGLGGWSATEVFL
ncbi:unnamed protein product [Polarella glacialis]|uniref:Uncharacterized protein n=1 Tax=Polarella glacialis TaxID=89957 RepID=A0A813JFG4_POLGL|nr:unnamed protein product [Polarella glacialis]